MSGREESIKPTREEGGICVPVVSSSSVRIAGRSRHPRPGAGLGHVQPPDHALHRFAGVGHHRIGVDLGRLAGFQHDAAVDQHRIGGRAMADRRRVDAPGRRPGPSRPRRAGARRCPRACPASMLPMIAPRPAARAPPSVSISSTSSDAVAWPASAARWSARNPASPAELWRAESVPERHIPATLLHLRHAGAAAAAAFRATDRRAGTRRSTGRTTGSAPPPRRGSGSCGRRSCWAQARRARPDGRSAACPSASPSPRQDRDRSRYGC